VGLYHEELGGHVGLWRRVEVLGHLVERVHLHVRELLTIMAMAMAELQAWLEELGGL
jgi:hypothetical protein